MNDWRKDYVICKHVAEDEAKGTRHSGFRVCCDECAHWGGDAQTGFLYVEPLTVTERPDGLAVGEFEEAK